jgi:hypothetical protein
MGEGFTFDGFDIVIELGLPETFSLEPVSQS